MRNVEFATLHVCISELSNIKLGEEIEEGGEGVVYEATWLTTPFAAKVICGKLNERILDECKLLQ